MGIADVTAPRNIEHVTLDTGEVCRSPRSAIEDEIIRVLGAGFDRAITTGALEPIPGWSPFSYNVTAEAGGIMVTLWRESAPVVTFGVAAEAKDNPKLWRLLHQGGARRHTTSPDRPPVAPWIGLRAEIGAALTAPDDLLWIADFERCLAWAFIDRHARTQ